MPSAQTGLPLSGIKQVCVLPYAGLDRTIKVGPFHFWPWHEYALARRYIPDEALRLRVDKEVARYVNWFGEPIQTQCVVSIVADGTCRLVCGDEQGFGAALAFLTLAYLLPVVPENPVVAEHFIAVVLPLPEEGQPYHLVSQGLHNLRHVITPEGVQVLRFQAPRQVDGIGMRQRPWHIGLGPAVRVLHSRLSIRALFPGSLPDAEILRMGSLLLGQVDSRETQRIIESIHWHNLGVRQDESLDHGVRAVAMCTAFETLFYVGERRDKVRRVVKEVDALLAAPGERTYRVRKVLPASGTSAHRAGEVVFEGTRKAYVVHKLYQWRRKVVHGSPYVDKDLTMMVCGPLFPEFTKRTNLVLLASRVFGMCIRAVFCQRFRLWESADAVDHLDNIGLGPTKRHLRPPS